MEYDGSCYQLVQQTLDWFSAREHCQNAGGFLADAYTEDENNVMTLMVFLIGQTGACHIFCPKVDFLLNLIHMGHQCTSNNVNTKEKCYLFDDETVENSTAFYEFGDQCHEMVLGFTAFNMSIDE